MDGILYELNLIRITLQVLLFVLTVQMVFYVNYLRRRD